MPLVAAARLPVSTYRVQLHAGHTFDHVAALAPHLAALGVTDCYCSPILQSAPGSTHGYDVSDYRKISPEIGGGESFRRFSEALATRGIGVLVDFVPNHMGIDGPFNTWWSDVLESGLQSRFAQFFDIHWNATASPDVPRVLVALLGDHLGRVLEQGELRLARDGGALSIWYYETRLPLSPRSYRLVLLPLVDDPRSPPETRDELREIAEGMFSLPHPLAREEHDRAEARVRDLAGFKRRLRDLLDQRPELARLVDEKITAINGAPGDPASFDTLEAILAEQHYRLARWTTGTHETNYRRFFAINSLIGLRMEMPEVFEESHQLVGQLIGEGRITGLRIDHIDGLWDPEEYLERLQQLARPAGSCGPPAPFFVLVEKILEDTEQLPCTWAAHGTTGYEFIAQLADLFVNPAAERKFTETYSSFTGETERYGEILYARKRLMLEETFANAVQNLAAALAELVAADRRWCDLTRQELAVAIREIMAGLNVYRTYRRAGAPMTPEDERVIDEACARAVLRNRNLDTGAFAFVRDVLAGRYPGDDAPAGYRDRLGAWTLSFQQYTPAIMAKSAEDTAFYVYNRLIALNEVGGNPASFGGNVADFHAANLARLERAPHSLLATSTHDTKVSEDVRARLYALSEIPEEWEAWISDWSQVNRRHKLTIDGRLAPDANEEYRLYQVLLGAWPLDGAAPDETFRTRIREHVRKAVSEAKRNTTWLYPNEPWLAAGDRFVDAILTAADFLQRIVPAAARVAHPGMVNSLVQVVLKTTSPGAPDFYQGNEWWDFSLVDPDNRRPVDYTHIQALSERVQQRSWRELLREWRDGGVKLKLTQTLLRWRREHAALFQSGNYRALPVRGRFAGHVAAFSRQHQMDQLLVVVPRLTAKIGTPPLGLVWEDTIVSGVPTGAWTDVVTGVRFTAGENGLFVADLLEELPFAVLWRAA